VVHYPRFGLVAEDPRGSLSQVWFGSGGFTCFNIQGLVWFQMIHVVHHPLVSEDPRRPPSQVWFGSGVSTSSSIPRDLVWEDPRGSSSKA
jgi:hypothetical protein